jgi:hypothetical protein
MFLLALEVSLFGGDLLGKLCALEACPADLLKQLS